MDKESVGIQVSFLTNHVYAVHKYIAKATWLEALESSRVILGKGAKYRIDIKSGCGLSIKDIGP